MSSVVSAQIGASGQKHPDSATPGDANRSATTGLRLAFYDLVESLSAIRKLSDIDLRTVSERQLLQQAATVLVESQGLASCAIHHIRAGAIEPLLRVGCQDNGRISELPARVPESSGESISEPCSHCNTCGLVAATSVSGRPTAERDVRTAAQHDGMVCVPLVVFERHWGFLHAYYSDSQRMPLANRQSLTLFGRILSQMIESVALFADMERAVTKKAKQIVRTNKRLRGEVEQRARAEAELRQAKDRFKDFAETAADWFWETDHKLRVRYLSERFEPVTGISPQLLINRDPIAFPDGITPIYWKEQVEEIRQRRPFAHMQVSLADADGESRILCISGKPVVDNRGRFLGYRGAGQDITKAYKMSQELAYHARHDSLTGLLNRREFEQNLDRVLAATRHGGGQHVLCYLDLDQFKVVNDTCGHVAGDELLRHIAEVLSDVVRKRDTLARLGGDEFGLLLEDCSLAEANRAVSAVCRAVEEFRFHWANAIFSVTASVGVVPIDEHSDSVASALSAADAACYAAKNKGRNRIHVSDAGDDELARNQQEMQWVSKITGALQDDRFELYFQPIVPVVTAAAPACSFELLLRMRTEDGTLVLPGTFLPAAERYALSTRIDRWVARRTLAWLRQNIDGIDGLGWCSINLSGHSLSDPSFLEILDREFSDSGVPGDKVCFEITETAAISNMVNSIAFIERFKDRGCHFALDDFGSGLSSFAYLKTLPVDYVKIDGLFVRDLANDSVDYAMVKSINEISQVMGKKTIAEYVDNQVCLSALADIGVDFAQGYGIARPQPLSPQAMVRFDADWAGSIGQSDS